MKNHTIKEEKVLKKLLFPKIKLYWDHLQKNLGKVKRKSSTKPLRVSIRRLRALLDIIREIIRGRADDSYLGELKELIRIFGDLRDLHVQHDLITNLNTPRIAFLMPYLKKMEKKIAREYESLRLRIQSVRLSHTRSIVKKILASKRLPLRVKKRHRLLAGKNLSCPVVRSLLQKYLMGCFARLPLARRGENQEEFHKLRVRVKRLRYKLEILHPLVRPDFSSAGLAYFRDLQDVMGETHDLDVACRDVERFFSRCKPSLLKKDEYRTWRRIMAEKRQLLFQKSWKLLKRLEQYDFLSLG